jgi:hypothetical protein
MSRRPSVPGCASSRPSRQICSPGPPSDYDLAAQADPAKIVSLASVRIKQASPGIALFRPFPPTPSGFQRRSHFGGLPDLPAGCEWPRHELLGPLHFVAQIDFAELTHNIPDLPQEGTLLFFASLSNAKIESPPIIIFDPDSTGRQAEMPGFRHSLGGSQGLLRLPGDAMHAEFLLPYWPIGTGLVETLPAPATLDANACLKPEYAGYCRAHDSFRQGQFAIAAAPLKVDSRQWGHEQRSWRKELFAAHVTLHPWTWRGLLYVAEGIAGSFAHPEISQSAARWMAESRKHDLDSPIPSAVGEQFARLVDTAREEEERLYMRNEKAGRWDALGGSNARAIERLLLDAAAQPAIAASLPRELLATLAESHVASPSGPDIRPPLQRLSCPRSEWRRSLPAAAVPPSYVTRGRRRASLRSAAPSPLRTRVGPGQAPHSMA